MPARKSHPRRPARFSAKSMNPPSVASSLSSHLLAVLCPLFVLVLVIGYSASYGFRSMVLKSTNHVEELHPNQSTDLQVPSVGIYTYEIVNEFDHDPNAFTQGLVFAGNDTLYESTGLWGSSSVRKVQVQTGEIRKLHQMERKYFGEGLTLMNHRLFQVAWRMTSGFIYDESSLTQLGTFEHPMKDGWGLTTDGIFIYGSDGSSTIYAMQPSTFAEQRRFIVKDQEKEITHLNELEYVNHELWANVWMKNCIVRISPEDGRVLGWILLHNLRHNLLAGGYMHVDVLNGIAWDGDHDRIYVTGKLWPKLYEIKVHSHPKNFTDREDVWKMCNI